MAVKKKYQLTASARADLRDIKEYTVEVWGTAQAKKYLADIRKTLSILAANPLAGSDRPDTRDGARGYPYKRHVIYYAIVKNHIIVFGILNKTMLPKPHLTDREIL
ncbi:type II toxin-antitoxin system RelE/ParE family toxin [Chromatiaceae bacterium AAb-1]|nr:type II toxin-antitoxin system RelE/ParE family toxin [Chromatiaceae bacterium AAb-1]